MKKFLKTLMFVGTLSTAAGTLFAGTDGCGFDFFGTDFSEDAVCAGRGRKDFVNAILKSEFLLNGTVKKNAKYFLVLCSASWCGPCRKEMPKISKEYSEKIKKTRDVELVMISYDRDEESMKTWAEKEGIEFPVIMNKPEMTTIFGTETQVASGIPHLYVFEADGTLVKSGHPENILKQWRELTSKSKKNKKKQKDIPPSHVSMETPGFAESAAFPRESFARSLADSEFVARGGQLKKNAEYFVLIYSASWCEPCHLAMPEIVEAYKNEVKNDPDIEFVLMSCDCEKNEMLQWASQAGMEFPIAHAFPRRDFIFDTGVVSPERIPAVYIFRADGTLVKNDHPAKIFKDYKTIIHQDKEKHSHEF